MNLIIQFNQGGEKERVELPPDPETGKKKRGGGREFFFFLRLVDVERIMLSWRILYKYFYSISSGPEHENRTCFHTQIYLIGTKKLWENKNK